jgi:glycerol-3-phosphate responsive antiterminator
VADGGAVVVRLPPVLVADDGRHGPGAAADLEAGVLLRDTDLPTLVREATAAGGPLAVDIDTIAGLGADESGVEFVVGRLGIGIVLTRRPQLAAIAADLGGLGLVQVLAFDSTGLKRALEGHPHRAGTGTVISPGLVLIHLDPAEVDSLPRPLVGYGLIDTPKAARAVLARADAIVIRPDTAAGMVRAERSGTTPLTAARMVL